MFVFFFEFYLLIVFEKKVLRVFENKVLRVFEKKVLRVFEKKLLRVFEKKVLRKIVGSEAEEKRSDWIKLHNEKLHGLFCTPGVIRSVKSRRKRRGIGRACSRN
jgi:hypothetical protein